VKPAAKILIFSLCLQIGFLNSAMLEIFSLPSLVEHYFEHSKEENIGFVKFLKLHYTENQHQNQSNPKHHHDSLPFHHQNGSITHYTFCIPVLFRLEKSKTSISESGNETSEYIFSVKDTIVKSFWHPPKSA